MEAMGDTKPKLSPAEYSGDHGSTVVQRCPEDLAEALRDSTDIGDGAAAPTSLTQKSVTTGILGKVIGVRSELSLKEVRDVFRALKLIASKEVKRTKKFEMRFGNARVRMMFGKEITVKAKPWKYFSTYACPIWSNLGPSWRQLGPSWGQLGPSWRQLGPT